MRRRAAATGSSTTLPLPLPLPLLLPLPLPIPLPLTRFVNGVVDESCHPHGTHCAGTVAGATAGVAKEAIIVPVMVLGCDGSGSNPDPSPNLNTILSPP